MNLPLVYALQVEDNTGAEHLKTRWTSPELSSFFQDLCAALLANKGIPKNPPRIDVSVWGKTIPFIDLRGINLKNFSIGSSDLSYCCFDGADLSGVQFNDTQLQYSSFKNTNFKGTQFLKVQASPIFAQRADFDACTISTSYFMYAEFADANFAKATIVGTALVGAGFIGAKLTALKPLHNVDVSDAHFTNSPDIKILLKSGTTGHCEFHEPERSYAERIKDYIDEAKNSRQKKISSTVTTGRGKSKRIAQYVKLIVDSVQIGIHGPKVVARVPLRRSMSFSARNKYTKVRLGGDLNGSFLKVGDVVEARVTPNGYEYVDKQMDIMSVNALNSVGENYAIGPTWAGRSIRTGPSNKLGKNSFKRKMR